MADDLDDSSSDEDDDSILGKSDSEDSDSEYSDSDESDSDHSEWDLQQALQAIQGDGMNTMHWGHSRLNY
jgi:hypothetical protein